MTSDARRSARAAREFAASLRRAADRLTLLRLRVANALGEQLLGGAGGGDVELRERWTEGPDLELGHLAASLRARARRVDALATAQERSSGRRLGGYQGAGFLGRGDDAPGRVSEVAAGIGFTEFGGPHHGATIGGYPLLPAATGGYAAHPSHQVGIQTPDYEERDED